MITAKYDNEINKNHSGYYDVFYEVIIQGKY